MNLSLLRHGSIAGGMCIFMNVQDAAINLDIKLILKEKKKKSFMIKIGARRGRKK
jgi:hypothetical protein